MRAGGCKQNGSLTLLYQISPVIIKKKTAWPENIYIFRERSVRVYDFR
ncbi:hypothetical protein HMPREF3213_01770 [Heyndrickxia coagulans]|uniref:Uncharacterized protein n=1 Tax=Heyndrickxia coagulans TaxID=1398 RepID=A0A133KS66_HEYCO|nr:hypothetical protein HMPREF3213_01770 [Heyndrickxia coagulans]